MPEVVGLGAMNLDRLYRVTRIVADGETRVQEVHTFPGGSAANTIFALAKLGVKTGFIGAVGDDDGGHYLIQSMEEVGIDTKYITVKPGSGTGEVLCLSDDEGHRALYVHPGANALLSGRDIPTDYANHARFLHLSSFADEPQLVLQKLLGKELSPQVRLSFAPGSLYTIKGLEALGSILKRTDFLFANQDEIRELTGEDLPVGARMCLDAGCKTLVVTLGGKSAGLSPEGRPLAAYIARNGEEHLIEAPTFPNLPLVDSTGAGDAFAAGFLYGLLTGRPLAACGALGHVLASFCISKLGARAGLPTQSELTKQYESANEPFSP